MSECFSERNAIQSHAYAECKLHLADVFSSLSLSLLKGTGTEFSCILKLQDFCDFDGVYFKL